MDGEKYLYMKGGDVGDLNLKRNLRVWPRPSVVLKVYKEMTKEMLSLESCWINPETLRSKRGQFCFHVDSINASFLAFIFH